MKASSTSALIGKKRKEATATEIKAYQKQFLEAKQLECKSWLDNEVFDLVDTRKVLRGFQDKQKNDQQTDSPAASRSGFRLAIQAAANTGWNVFHMDSIRLVTSFVRSLLKWDIHHTLERA